MKVLVTGANGFLGGHVIHELVSRGIAVRAMIRPGARTPALMGLDVEIFEGQISRREDIGKALEGCQLIIHTAANTTQEARGLDDYIPVNVTATRDIVEAMKQKGCKRMVFVSTSNTIGYGSLTHPGTEDNPPARVFMKSGYARSKFIAEQVVQEAVQKGDIEAVVVNPGFLIGPMDYHPNSGKIFLMALNHRVILCPPGGKSLVDVRDAAHAIVNAIKLGENGSNYLLTGHNISFREFFHKTLEISMRKAMIIPIPSIILLLAGGIGSLLSYLGKPAKLHITNARILCVKNYYSNRKAMDSLVMPTTPLHQTIQDAVDWYGKNHQR